MVEVTQIFPPLKALKKYHSFIHSLYGRKAHKQTDIHTHSKFLHLGTKPVGQLWPTCSVSNESWEFTFSTMDGNSRIPIPALMIAQLIYVEKGAEVGIRNDCEYIASAL